MLGLFARSMFEATRNFPISKTQEGRDWRSVSGDVRNTEIRSKRDSAKYGVRPAGWSLHSHPANDRQSKKTR